MLYKRTIVTLGKRLKMLISRIFVLLEYTLFIHKVQLFIDGWYILTLIFTHDIVSYQATSVIEIYYRSFFSYNHTAHFISCTLLWYRRVWRYQRGNQNPYIEEEQTKQWSKEKVQKDKQRSTNIYIKLKIE